MLEDKLNLLTNSVGMLFLIVSMVYLTPLLSCGIQSYFTHNVLVKHLMLFLIIVFYVLMFSRNQFQPDRIDDTWVFPELILIALIIYLVFILMGKLQPMYVVSIVFAIVVHMWISLEKGNKNEKLAKVLDFIQFVLMVFILIVIVLGVSIYYYKKRKDYGKEFSHITFFFGTEKCKRLK